MNKVVENLLKKAKKPSTTTKVKIAILHRALTLANKDVDMQCKIYRMLASCYGMYSILQDESNELDSIKLYIEYSVKHSALLNTVINSNGIQYVNDLIGLAKQHLPSPLDKSLIPDESFKNKIIGRYEIALALLQQAKVYATNHLSESADLIADIDSEIRTATWFVGEYSQLFTN